MILAIDPLDKTAARYQAIAKQQVMEPFCKDAAEAFQNENYATAIELWDKLFKMNPDDRRFSNLIEITKNLITDKTTGVMYTRAEQFITDGDYKSTLGELEKILTSAPMTARPGAYTTTRRAMSSMFARKSTTTKRTRT